MIYTLW